MQTPPDKKSANKRSADYVSLHPPLSITSPPLLLCQHVALWGHSDLHKVFSNPGRKELGCILWPHDPGSLCSDPQVSALAWGGQNCKGWSPPWLWQAWELALWVLTKLWWHQMTASATADMVTLRQAELKAVCSSKFNLSNFGHPFM